MLRRLAQSGHPEASDVRLTTAARQPWDGLSLHRHHTMRLEPGSTSSGVREPLRSGFPLVAELRVDLGERGLGRDTAVRAEGARGLVPRPVSDARAPLVRRDGGAPPPRDARGRRDHALGAELPVQVLVPLTGDEREAPLEAIRDRNALVRAVRATAAGGTVVGLRAPDVVEPARATPPDATRRPRPDVIGGQDTVSFVVPLLHQLRVTRNPVPRVAEPSAGAR